MMVRVLLGTKECGLTSASCNPQSPGGMEAGKGVESSQFNGLHCSFCGVALCQWGVP